MIPTGIVHAHIKTLEILQRRVLWSYFRRPPEQVENALPLRLPFRDISVRPIAGEEFAQKVIVWVDSEVQCQHVTEFMETNEVDELADGGLKGNLVVFEKQPQGFGWDRFLAP